MLKTLYIYLTDLSTGEIIGHYRKDTSSEDEVSKMADKWCKCFQRGIRQSKDLALMITYKPFPAYDKNFLDYIDENSDKPF